MRLDVFLIADAATSVEGKMFVHGGGIGRIDALIWPWTHPMMAVIARFALSEDERATSHTATLRLKGPDGETIVEAGQMEWPAGSAPPIVEDEQSFWDIFLGFGLMTFREEGTYTWELECDGIVHREFKMPVRRTTSD